MLDYVDLLQLYIVYDKLHGTYNEHTRLDTTTDPTQHNICRVAQ